MLAAVTKERDEGLDLVVVNVLLQEFAVVVDQGSNGVLGEDPVPNLALHRPQELVGDLFLK